jgi:hypothetical protein
MKTFEIKESTNEYPIVIYSLSYVSPLGSLPIIEKELESYRGKVLFDLLMCNGLASNRFIVADYDGDKFDVGSFTITQVGTSIKKESLSFYMTDPSLLENSVLPRPHQFLIKKGRIA